MDNPRFTPGEFAYNGRVALALLPSLLVFAMLGGRFVVSVLTIGSMVSYIMDALQLREGACATVWLMLLVSNVALTVNVVATGHNQPALLLAGAILAMWAVLGVTFAWATLQFRWIQMKYPAVVVAFERLVISASFPVATVALTLGIAALAPPTTAPFYVLALAAALYYALCRPLPSSFQTPPRPAASGPPKAPPPAVQTKADAFWAAVLLVALPPAFYAAIHWPALLRHMLHIWSLLLLLALPILFLTLVPNALWWLPGPPAAQHAARIVWLSASLGAAIVGFEGRVIFHAFDEYIHLPPPWNWIAVTVALVGFALLATAHLSGVLNPEADITLAGTVLLLCTTAGSLAAGVPFTWLPAPLVAACGLALYYDTRSLREYACFLAGALVTASWFLYSHFWFLDFSVQGMSVHTICKLALAALLPALLVPGLVAARASKQAIGGLLVLQAALIATLEDRLYTAGRGPAPESEDESMYPAYLVVATTALGLVAVRKLLAAGQCARPAAWVACCVHGAKVAVLLLPREGVVAALLPLALAVTAPLMLLDPEAPAAGGRAARRGPRLTAKLAGYHAALVVVAVVHARFAVFDMVQWLGAARPSEGLLLGALVLTTGAAWAPLVAKLQGRVAIMRRALAVLTVLGALMVLLQPPLPIPGGARCPKLPFGLCPRLWDERHIPLHDADDVAIWGTGLAARTHWPRWLLVAAAAIATALYPAAQATPLPLPRQAVFTLVTMYCGALVGIYVVVELLPGQFLCQLLACLSCGVVGALLALLRPTPARSPAWLPLLLVLWGGLMAVALVARWLLPLPDLPPEARRLFPDQMLQVQDEREAASQGGLLALLAAQCLLLAFALKLRVTAAIRAVDRRAAGTGAAGDVGAVAELDAEGFPVLPMRGGRRGGAGADFFCGIVPSSMLSSFGTMLKLEGAAAVRQQRLAQQGLAWVPTACNLLTLAAFLLALLLAPRLTHEPTPEAIFTLAPLLLLLHQDPLILPVLGDRQRYFAPAVATAIYLALSAASAALAAPFTSPEDLDSDSPTSPWAFATRNLALLFLTVPNHLMLLRHLWAPAAAAASGAALPLLLAPINLLPLLLADIPALQYLAAAAAAGALLQYFTARHLRHVGMRMI